MKSPNIIPSLLYYQPLPISQFSLFQGVKGKSLREKKRTGPGKKYTGGG